MGDAENKNNGKNKGEGNKNSGKNSSGKGNKDKTEKAPENVQPKAEDLDTDFEDSKVLSNGMIAEKSKCINLKNIHFCCLPYYIIFIRITLNISMCI